MRLRDSLLHACYIAEESDTQSALLLFQLQICQKPPDVDVNISTIVVWERRAESKDSPCNFMKIRKRPSSLHMPESPNASQGLVQRSGFLASTLRTSFSTNCPQRATKCHELVDGRGAVGGHQPPTNIALSDLLWTKPDFKGCLIDGWRPVLADELGGALHCGMVLPNSR
jgi:hypothetical protein